ncbi:MAG: hypothetical protein NTY22_05080 [Proteobacteria bacterium]|nr:hypothetical protein [Pseudomonadota bacterium]
MFDNIAVLSFLAGILIFVFQFPADIVYKKMFPGTAFGVLFGDLAYTWMAYKLAKKNKNPNVTAMPLGLDTPSTIGIALAVLGPAFIAMKARGMDPHSAAMMTWYIGMATMVMIGILKLVLSFAGGWVQRIVPQAGLLGSIAGIALVLIGFIPLVDIFGMPVVGMVAIGLILYNLVAHIKLPFNLPGVFMSVLLGTVLYYILGHYDLLGFVFSIPKPEFHFGLPIPTLGFMSGIHEALRYLPIAIPFGLLTVVGGINVTESARVAGDDYNTKNILLVEAVATLIAGVCGGVAQSTPYIGHPAYKKMGSKLGYTLLTGLFIGLGGMLGYVSFIVELIPRAVLAPILVFVAIDIMSQAFLACPAKHAPAVAFAFFPTMARLMQIKLSNTAVVAQETFEKLMTTMVKGLPELQVTVALGNGFILTAMLWGGMLAALIDKKLRQCITYLLILAFFTFFGIIHSAMPDGNMYFPWMLNNTSRMIPYQFTTAYLVLAGLFLLLSFTKESRENFKPY